MEVTLGTETSINLLIRADTSERLGAGHVMRMIALGDACHRRGIPVTLMSSGCSDSIIGRIESVGIEFVNMPEDALGSKDDARATIEFAKIRGMSWVVLDGYQFDQGYQSWIREAGLRVFTMDDYGHCEEWNTDVILNQNIGKDLSDYVKVPKDTKLLLGPTFALIRREFVKEVGRHRRRFHTRKALRNILVTFGNSDPVHMTMVVLESLIPTAENQDWVMRAVAGSGNSQISELKALEKRYSRIEVFDSPDMVEMMNWADIAISGAGGTCWEFCYLGVPMVLIPIAENQRGIAEGLNQYGVAVNLGWYKNFDPSILIGAIEGLSDKLVRSTMSTKAFGIVDGAGAGRIAAIISGRLKITIATAKEGWVLAEVSSLAEKLNERGHRVVIVYDVEDIMEGDIAMFLSFWSLVPDSILERNLNNLVVHASALPHGKGWSPLSWQIIEGASEITVTLFEAEKKVDSGKIYSSRVLNFEGHELLSELRMELMNKTMELCLSFVDDYSRSVSSGRAQSGESTFYARRGPEDSRLDPSLTLASQFDLLRTVDNENYPAFFDYRGHRYQLKIEKLENGY